MSQSSQQKLLALATVAIIALLGLSAFLIYTKINQDKLMKGQSSELIQQTNLKAELEKEYHQAVHEVAESVIPFMEDHPQYKKAKIPAELHIYSNAGHGFGVRDKNKGAVGGWLQRFIDWLSDSGFLKN